MQRAATDVIEDAAWRTRYKVAACAQLVHLATHGRATVDRYDGQRSTLGDATDFGGHLQRQLSRGAEHQRLRVAVFDIGCGVDHRLNERDAKRGGLSRPGARLHD